MEVYIAYAEDAGYYIVDSEGYIVSSNWFSKYVDAEDYCIDNNYLVCEFEEV